MNEGQNFGTPAFAYGTGADFIPAPPTFISGDTPEGMPTPYDERVDVRDPEGNAMVRVTPNEQTMTKAAGGGLLNGVIGGGPLAKLMHAIGDLLDTQGGAAAEQPPRFATGTGEAGVFGGMIGQTGIEWLDKARALNQQSAQEGLARSPWETYPTPVGVSAPGTSSYLQEIAAGLTASGTGIPRRAFLNEALRARPTGMPQYLQRRTA